MLREAEVGLSQRWKVGANSRLAQQNGWHGYRRITAPLRNDGRLANGTRVERIHVENEGLNVLQKQPMCSRLWFNDGSCGRPRLQYPSHL